LRPQQAENIDLKAHSKEMGVKLCSENARGPNNFRKDKILLQTKHVLDRVGSSTFNHRLVANADTGAKKNK